MNTKLKRRLHSLLLFVFLAFYLNHLIIIGFDVIDTGADVAACITLTVLYALVLYQFIGKSKLKWWKSPEILTSSGLLIYLACSVPYISLSSYIYDISPELYMLLYRSIVDILAILRYLLLLISFIMIYRSKGKNQLVLEHENDKVEI